jgi:hypothetical protein
MSRQGLERQFLATREAAEWLDLKPNTLEKMRIRGNGPMFRKHGRYVRYHREDLIAWSEANKQQCTANVR